jgi:hypothetical protein
MKALIQLSNTERGKLLAELFPEELPHMVDYIANSCEQFRANAKTMKALWNNGFITFDCWCKLAESTVATITRCRYNMVRSNKVFSDQLFYGTTALISIDCIIRYAATAGHNPKFQQAVNLLFS